MTQPPSLWTHLGVSAAIGAIAAIAAQIVVGGMSDNSISAGSNAALVIWVAFVLGGLFLYVRQSIKFDNQIQQADEAARVAKREEEERRAKQAEDDARSAELARIETLRTQVEATAVSAVALFEDLPRQLADAKRHRRSAEARLVERVYSPFWESIEQAYLALGTYQSHLQVIADLSGRYSRTAAELSAVGEPVGPFPVNLSAAEAAAVARSEADLLARATYEAHKDGVFGSIWEQRRTTAAVVSGFASMAQAMADMQTVIASRVRELTEAVRNGGNDTLIWPHRDGLIWPRPRHSGAVMTV